MVRKSVLTGEEYSRSGYGNPDRTAPAATHTAGAGRCLDERRLLDLEASLRRAQGRFTEALALLRRALELAAPGHATGRLLVIVAKTREAMGDYEAALAALQQARPLVDAERDPRLPWVLRQNLGFNLCHLGRHLEASELLPALRAEAQRLGNELDRLRLRWLEGVVAAGLGRSDEAVAALTGVRERFVALENPYDAALATLELAVVYAQEGRTSEVKTLARESALIFTAQQVHAGAQAALRLFGEAAEAERLTARLACQLAAYLHKARCNPGLRFEEAAANGPG